MRSTVLLVVATDQPRGGSPLGRHPAGAYGAGGPRSNRRSVSIPTSVGSSDRL